MSLSNNSFQQISVIIPVYDVRLDWVQESIASALSLQDVAEVLVIDDGSSNVELVDFLAGLPNQDSRVRYLRQQNQGVAAARNLGLENARGHWITFLDPDDRITSATGLTDILETSGGADLIVMSAVGISADTGQIRERYSLSHFSHDSTADQLLVDMMQLYRVGRESSSFVIGVPWAKLIRREYLLENDLKFDPTVVKRSDAEWMLRLLSNSPTTYVQDLQFIEYRIDIPGSISNRYRPEILDSYLQITRTAAKAELVPARVQQLYAVELLKDSINNVFSNPAAPSGRVTKAEYLRFRDYFTVTSEAKADRGLEGAGLPRKLLYLAIWKRWYWPVSLLRKIKKSRALLCGRGVRQDASPQSTKSSSTLQV